MRAHRRFLRIAIRSELRVSAIATQNPGLSPIIQANTQEFPKFLAMVFSENRRDYFHAF